MQEKDLLKHAAMQIVAGGSAGCVEVSIMHPLDLVKTRFQLQSAVVVAGHPHYTSIAHCMKTMYHSEGVLSFWKGILPPLFVETPKRAWKFFTFEQFKTAFVFGGPGSVATPMTFMLAGLASGVTEAIIVNPFEVIKVKMQSNRAHQSQSPSTAQVAKQILAEEGLLGGRSPHGGGGLLFKAITASMARNGCFNMVYFGFYHSVKDIVPKAEDYRLELLRRLGIGFMAGTLGSVCNIPFDVVKSRIQGPQPVVGQVKYQGTLKTIVKVYQEEGFLALYKGLAPKVLRLGPGGAIMLLVYENVYEYLQKKYPD